MERLTRRTSDGITIFAGDGTPTENALKILGVLRSLAAYEDTGLEPGICAEYKKFEDELVSNGKTFQHAIDLLAAEKDGRLTVLPCKVGDTVWKIRAAFSYFTKPMEDRIDRIIISDNQVLMCCTSGAKFSIGSVGKTIFDTREAAEKALEMVKDD